MMNVMKNLTWTSLTIQRAEGLKQSLEALARLNLAYLKEHPECPKLFESDVAYAPDIRSECYSTVPGLLASGRASVCEIVAWRVAELTLEGRPATVRITWDRNVLTPSVRHQDGTLEQPALIVSKKGQGQ